MLAIGTKPSGLHCSYWWGIDDRHGLDNLLLVRLRTGSVHVTDDRGHTGLVAHGGRQMDGLLGVILGEAAKRHSRSVSGPVLRMEERIFASRVHLRLDLSAMAGGTLPGQEGQRAMAGSLKLAVLLDVSFFEGLNWNCRCRLTLILGGLYGGEG